MHDIHTSDAYVDSENTLNQLHLLRLILVKVRQFCLSYTLC